MFPSPSHRGVRAGGCHRIRSHHRAVRQGRGSLELELELQLQLFVIRRVRAGCPRTRTGTYLAWLGFLYLRLMSAKCAEFAFVPSHAAIWGQVAKPATAPAPVATPAPAPTQAAAPAVSAPAPAKVTPVATTAAVAAAPASSASPVTPRASTAATSSSANSGASGAVLASLAKVVEERSAELTEVKKKLAEKEQEAAAKAKEADEFRAQVRQPLRCAGQPLLIKAALLNNALPPGW